MSNEKFTKGPWYAKNDLFVCNTVNDDVAIVLCDNIFDDASKAEAMAEASLIAAAPEMYEMLKQLLDAEGVIKTNHNRSAIKQLLSKARGEHV